MAPYGITLTQLAKYSETLSTERNEKNAELNQRAYYTRFCAVQYFAELIREDISINNIVAIGYTEWKMGCHEVQRSSTPLFGSRDSEMIVVPLEKENAALLMLMGRDLSGANTSISMSKSTEAIDYNEWKMIVYEVQRSSTPLLGSRESEVLGVPFEKQDAALLMLMGHKIIESEY